MKQACADRLDRMLTICLNLRMETDPVSEMSWSFVKLPHTRRWTESKRSQIVLYKHVQSFGYVLVPYMA
jgi:hypothetical protein